MAVVLASPGRSHARRATAGARAWAGRGLRQRHAPEDGVGVLPPTCAGPPGPARPTVESRAVTGRTETDQERPRSIPIAPAGPRVITTARTPSAVSCSAADPGEPPPPGPSPSRIAASCSLTTSGSARRSVSTGSVQADARLSTTRRPASAARSAHGRRRRAGSLPGARRPGLPRSASVGARRGRPRHRRTSITRSALIEPTTTTSCVASMRPRTVVTGRVPVRGGSS